MYQYMYGNYPQYQQQTYQPQQQMAMQYQMPSMPQQMQRNNGLNGGIVEDFAIITANDVPMDGNGAVFVKRDGSEIQVRNWTSNGTIATSVFKPVKMEEANKLSNGNTNNLEQLSGAFEDKFNRLFEKMDKLEEAVIEISMNKGEKQ